METRRQHSCFLISRRIPHPECGKGWFSLLVCSKAAFPSQDEMPLLERQPAQPWSALVGSNPGAATSFWHDLGLTTCPFDVGVPSPTTWDTSHSSSGEWRGLAEGPAGDPTFPLSLWQSLPCTFWPVLNPTSRFGPTGFQEGTCSPCQGPGDQSPPQDGGREEGGEGQASFGHLKACKCLLSRLQSLPTS